MTTRDTEGDVLRRVIGYIISLLYKQTSHTIYHIKTLVASPSITRLQPMSAIHYPAPDEYHTSKFRGNLPKRDENAMNNFASNMVTRGTHDVRGTCLREGR